MASTSSPSLGEAVDARRGVRGYVDNTGSGAGRNLRDRHADHTPWVREESGGTGPPPLVPWTREATSTRRRPGGRTEDTVSESSDILQGGSEADLQEQGATGRPGGDADRAGTGTGGSEADLQEQGMPAASGDDGYGGGIAGEGTGGSEADRLEQAADVPLDGEDAFPYGGTDDPAV
jgi:hypothetical protein